MLSIGLLSACGNASLKEESKNTIKTVKSTFSENAKKPNKKSGFVQFYLPFGYEIEEESPNNIILKNGSKTYILFVNPEELPSSEVVYKSTMEQYKDIDINEKFTKNDKFGFLLIKQLEESHLDELTIGSGGAKITTRVKTSSLKNEAKTMTQIVNSVKYTK